MRKLYFFLLLCLAHLSADNHLVQICDHPRIYIINEFLSDAECDHLIKIARPNLTDSMVVDEQNRGLASDKRRTSRGFFIQGRWKDHITIGIEKRIAALTGLPFENGEDLHVLCYGVGAEYKPHYDYFNPSTPGGSDCLRRGGQRIASFIMYLNTPDAGGHTIFPRAQISVTPRKGDAVFFYNCTPNGAVDSNSLHGGAPVIAGEKWIMTKWIRERPFK